MKIAETSKSLAPEQYGSRKHHRAIDLAVCKVLTYDLLRQLKRSGAICSNDAKSCYDLIGHTPASIAMQRFGVSRSAIDCLFTTLQEAWHQVRTGFGDSYLSYGGPSLSTPMHGIGQGNGAGPAIWAVLSSPLLNTLRSKGFGSEFCSPISSTLIQFVGYAFVDDSDVVESKPHQSHYRMVTQNLQQAVDTWEGGLKATCGAIVPEKTFWYLIDFKWSSGFCTYKTIEDSPSSIFVNDISGQRQEIRRCQPYDAQETLGIFLAPDGNYRQQLNKMLQIATKWADGMRSGRIPKDDAWLAFQSTVWKSLLHPLPALSLTPEDCDSIMRPLLHYLLPAIGVCQNYPRSLVYSSTKHMGLGVPNLHTTQEIHRLKDLLCHVDHCTTMGSLYRTSFEVMLIELGMGTDLTSMETTTMSFLATDSLIKSSLLFLRKHNIELRHDISLPFLRSADKILMNSFIQLSPSLDDLRALNNCRLYLQVMFLSEICTGDGLELTHEAWSGQRLDVPQKIASWPKQNKPLTREWQTWQLFLKKAFLHRGLKLRETLGHWSREDNQWEWYFSPTYGRLFHCDQGVWRSFHQITRRLKNPIFEAVGQQQIPPADLERATIYKKGHKIICTGHSPILSRPAPQARSFSDFLMQSKEDEKWCLACLTFEDDGAILALAISQGDAIAVSDGSYQDTYGTASWVLEGTNSTGRILGDVVVPGNEHDQTAYRSELTGIYAILLTVSKLCQYYKINRGAMELGCDGKSALEKALGNKPINIEDSNYDLLSAIRKLRNSTPISWTTRHIKGHQDASQTLDELDRWALLNVEMDTRAKNHISVARRKPRHSAIANEPWSLWYQGKKIANNISMTLYDIVHTPAVRSYWMRKDTITEEVLDTIHWEAVGDAMQAVPRKRRVFISKHTCGMCGVGKFMHRWKQREDSSCPRCGEHEDSGHVWKCHGEGADEVWEKSISALEGWMIQSQMDPDIQHTIFCYLNAWRSDSGTPLPNNFFLEEALSSQGSIGWRRFFEGWLSIEWALTQQAYYSLIRSRRTGKRWVVSLIQKLWDIAWDLWEHRNGILHEKTNLVSDAELHTIDRNIRNSFLHLRSISLPAHDRHLLSISLTRLLRKDRSYKSEWLRLATIVLQSKAHEQWLRRTSNALLIRGMQHGMQHFLNRRSD
jgi:hypothetical protein